MKNVKYAILICIVGCTDKPIGEPWNRFNPNYSVTPVQLIDEGFEINIVEGMAQLTGSRDDLTVIYTLIDLERGSHVEIGKNSQISTFVYRVKLSEMSLNRLKVLAESYDSVLLSQADSSIFTGQNLFFQNRYSNIIFHCETIGLSG